MSLRSLLATVIALVTTIILWYIRRILSRRNASQRQDGMRIVVESLDAQIDIVAVHGLGADPEHTWTTKARPMTSSGTQEASEKRRVNWLKDDGFLKRDFPMARVMTFGYNADWFLRAPIATAKQRARTLLRDLKGERVHVEKARPILFIGHSFGGIVIKHAICEAENDEDFKDVHSATSGVIFLGTPHQGSNTSSLGKLVALLTAPFFGSNAMLLRLLQKHSYDLSDLNDMFSQTIQRLQTPPLLQSFIETRHTLLFGWIPLGLIVDRDSASIGLGRSPVLIDTDHSGLNKCYSTDDRLYRELHTAIVEVLKISNRHATQISAEEEALRAQIVRWLSPPDPSENHETARASCQANTGRWFTEGTSPDDPFQVWKTQDSSFLWLHGIPGCGKSILNSSIIEKVRNEYANKSGVAVIYFYFAFNDVTKQGLKNLMLSLLHQLSPRGRPLSSYMRTLYENSKMVKDTTPIPEKALKQALCDLLSEYDEAYIILDALDESNENPTTLREFFNFIRPHAHILATSQNGQELEDQMTKIASMCIEVKTELVNHDIRLFVEGQMEDVQKLKRLPHALKEQIIEDLVNRAHGMFRWVACQLIEIQSCSTPVEVKNVLVNLPRSLDETYERILLKLSDKDSKIAKKILQWLIFSKEPMRIIELQELSTVDLDEGVQFNEERRLLYPEKVLEICGSLIITEPAGGFSYRLSTSNSIKESKIIRLAHSSVQEYLLSDRIREGNCQEYGIDGKLSQILITQTCCVYLTETYCQVKSKTFRKEYASFLLFDYAVAYWSHHARATENDEATNHRIVQFLSYKSLCRSMYERGGRLGLLLTMSKKVLDMQDNELSAYFASAAGLYGVFQILLEQEEPATSEMWSNTALLVASYYDHEAMVRQLLKKGTNVNAQLSGWSHETALIAAVGAGRSKVVELLLDNGADVNLQGGGYNNSALQAASIRGSKKVVEMLLAYGANANIQGGVYGNPLQTASYWGHSEVVKLLLNHGADVNALGGKYGSALRAASSSGKEKVIEPLLQYGADINAPYGELGCVLQVASSKSNEMAVDSLLKSGAKINARGGSYGTALQAALHEITCLEDNFLEHGLSQSHSFRVRRRVVEMLLRHGADVEVLDPRERKAMKCVFRTSLDRPNVLPLSGS